MNVDKMTEREIDADIARLLFNRDVRTCETDMGAFTINRIWLDAGDVFYHIEDEGYYAVHHYSTDANATREMEAEIQRRGLTEQYTSALLRIVSHDTNWNVMFSYEQICGDDLWKIATATPIERCRAALRVVLK